ncbi:S4 domain-containing protein YaaA [Chengkuizengella sp. SCS-71B]|uniref:S4 domain-containing protein YaaA n=1 Tax=Chengkuizengella sp. SCS-71B TaxID=3115290 RepID=UPI0032C20FA2
MEIIKIKDEYITLGQFLKLTNHISTGGQAKPFLQENKIYINGSLDNRRGRKIVPGDEVKINESGDYKVMNL